MERLSVLKTYKIFINGKFERAESGKVKAIRTSKEQLIANVCAAGRKDLKAAIVAARNAQGDWAQRTAYNRSQILYRMAEMLESRRADFLSELRVQGLSTVKARTEVDLSVDRLVYYAGWCDKYSAVFSSVNPVASSHHNFSVPEPMGVVVCFCPDTEPLTGLVSLLAPLIAGGNTCVMIASTKKPLSALSFAEVLATSDVPPGLINVLSGTSADFYEDSSLHRDVNALVVSGVSKAVSTQLAKNCSVNVKRLLVYDEEWTGKEAQSPYYILNAQEIKTTWQSTETFPGAGVKY